LQPLVISHLAIANSLGLGTAAIVDALRSNRSGLRTCSFEDVTL
jgi:hypothetical protein